MINKKRKKVILGMSGGVDSSVSAALLKKQGFEVIGVYLNLLNNKTEVKKNKSFQDAQKVAKALGISFKVFNGKDEFKKKVVGYFLNEYQIGNTPNPCVFCNENIKFKFLFEEMEKNEADYVATGHYACIKNNENSSGFCCLFQAKDISKDQSYFLYRLKQKQLKKILFPLGNLEKAEVKKIAKKIKLPISEKKESQDICFLEKMSVKNFLQQNINLKIGDIVDIRGNRIGEHQGLELYTIGQRKGIQIGGNGPYYVIKKDKKRNLLVVSNVREDLFLFSKSANLKKVNWVHGEIKLPTEVLIATRYQTQLKTVTLKKRTGGLKVEFNSLQKAISSGQSAVFYSVEGEVLGGGIII